VVGGGAGTIQGNRHLRYPKLTPIANLQLSFAHKFGLELTSFGDSTGPTEL
jgi:hypothetical protein